MNQELIDLLKKLNGNVEAINRGADVSKIAGQVPPAGDPTGVESKVTPDEMRQRNIDPLRKNFEDLAEAGYRNVGAASALDDPYSFIRRKSDDGNFQVNNARLGGMIATLMQKGARKEGMPLDQFMDRSGQRQAMEVNFEQALSKGVFGDAARDVEKALTSGGGSGAPLIRTDLEPIMREAYLRQFPIADLIGSIPANGLVHTYTVKTATGDADTVAELGDLTGVNADSTFVRKANSNVAIIASRRAISLKLQYASRQSGMNFNLEGSENTEVMSAITAIARKNQSLICQGNYSTASRTADDEDGNYNVNDFDGLRTILRSTGITKADDASASWRKSTARNGTAG